MFPLSLEGSVRLADAGPDPRATAERIADLFDRAGNTGAAVEGSEIRFKKTILSGSARALSLFDSGRLRVESEGTALRVVYSLSTLWAALAVTAMMALLTGIAALGSGTPALALLEIFVLGWLWLFGMNYLTAMFRFPRWLKRGLAGG